MWDTSVPGLYLWQHHRGSGAAGALHQWEERRTHQPDCGEPDWILPRSLSWEPGDACTHRIADVHLTIVVRVKCLVCLVIYLTTFFFIWMFKCRSVWHSQIIPSLCQSDLFISVNILVVLFGRYCNWSFSCSALSCHTEAMQSLIFFQQCNTSLLWAVCLYLFFGMDWHCLVFSHDGGILCSCCCGVILWQVWNWHD